MKRILGLLTALLLVSPAMAEDVAVATGEMAGKAWVVIDGEIYFCDAYEYKGRGPICYKAEMKD